MDSMPKFNQNIMMRIDQRINAAIANHNKILFIRYDVRFPVDYLHNGKNEEISVLMKYIKEIFELSLGTIHYVWVREKVSSRNPHYHVMVLINGSIMQNPYTFLLKIDETWRKLLKCSTNGLIHFCSNTFIGSNETGFIMIRRPSSKAQGAELLRQQCNFQQAYDVARLRASYLAKTFSKGNTPHRVREFGCSQL